MPFRVAAPLARGGLRGGSRAVGNRKFLGLPIVEARKINEEK